MGSGGDAARAHFDVGAVNDMTEANTLAHLLAFDSAYGKFCATVDASELAIIVSATTIAARAPATRPPLTEAISAWTS